MPGPIIRYVQVTDWISHKVGLVAMYLIFAMIGVLLLDAVTRYINDIQLHWCIEMAQMILAAYYILGGAHSMQLGDHVRMDLIYDRLSETGKAKMDVITGTCLIFYLGTLLWGSVSSMLYSYQYNQKLMSIWNPLVWPIKAIMVAGIILMLLQVFATLFKDIATARGTAIPGAFSNREAAL